MNGFRGKHRDRLRVFEQLALEHMDAIYNAAFRMTGSGSAAEDLVHETYLQAYRRFARFDGGASFKRWLFKVLRRTFVSRGSWNRRDPGAVALDEAGAKRPADDAFPGRANPTRARAAVPLSDELRAALAGLPEETRTMLLLAYEEGFGPTDIAQIMSRPVDAVRSRLLQARSQLQRHLARQVRRRRRAINATDVPGRVSSLGRLRPIFARLRESDG